MKMISNLQIHFGKPLLPAFFFLGGVAYDSLTLSRIDRLMDNLILLLYLSLLGALVVLTCRIQLGLIPDSPATETWSPLYFVNRCRPHFAKALQFLLGGLLSAYVIFYFQSASFTTTALFFGVIVVFLIVNEFLRNRLSSIKLLFTLYAMVTFSFFTFFLPVATGWMNTMVFLIGALLSGIVVWIVVRLVFEGASTRSRWEPAFASLPAFILILLFSGFYFWNWIPPIPLSLQFSGMYHKVEKANGLYYLSYHKGEWYQFWKHSEDSVQVDTPAYCFTAVFAPVSLNTIVYHHWQYRPANTSQQFLTTDRIPIEITGGRKKGYRGYTVKQRLNSGEWQVDVETGDGQIIGRIAFQVEKKEDDAHEVVSMIY